MADDELKLLKLKVQENKVAVGGKEVLRGLRAGTISTVFLATNVEAKMKDDILAYAALAQVRVVELSMNNEEVGVFCKKNYFISALAIVA